MAKHIWSVVCRQVVVDKFTNAVSIFDVVEEAHIEMPTRPSTPTSELPRAAVDFFVVSLWARNDSEGGGEKTEIQRTRCLDPAGRVVAQIEQKFEFREKMMRVRNIFNARGIPVSEPGVYVVQVQIQAARPRWKTVAEVPVRVFLEMPPSAPGSSSPSQH